MTYFVRGSVANENSKWKGNTIPIVIHSNVFPNCRNLHSDSVQQNVCVAYFVCTWAGLMLANKKEPEAKWYWKSHTHTVQRLAFLTSLSQRWPVVGSNLTINNKQKMRRHWDLSSFPFISLELHWDPWSSCLDDKSEYSGNN